MKLAICSDLHLEFNPIELKNTDNVDVLILSGDICVAEDLHRFPKDYQLKQALEPERLVNAKQYRTFFDQASKEFPHIIYVAGNHEFYGGKWTKTLSILRSEMSVYPNIHFLEDEAVKLGGFTFLGSTLWSDLNQYDPLTMFTIKERMNDYHYITYDVNHYCKILPKHTTERFGKSKWFISDYIEKYRDETFIVCTHHAPSFYSTREKFEDQITNGAYASNLESLIYDNPQIKVWTHGHIHSPSDYVIGSTRVICNPRGYTSKYSHSQNNFVLKTVEV